MKINIRKEVKIAVALLGLSFLIAFSERKQSVAVCKDIVVELDNLHENHFMDEAEILKLVEESGQPIKGVSIGRVNLKGIEAKLKFILMYEFNHFQ